MIGRGDGLGVTFAGGGSEPVGYAAGHSPQIVIGAAASAAGKGGGLSAMGIVLG